jgi:hypothetical protein
MGIGKNQETTMVLSPQPQCTTSLARMTDVDAKKNHHVRNCNAPKFVCAAGCLDSQDRERKFNRNEIAKHVASVQHSRRLQDRADMCHRYGLTVFTVETEYALMKHDDNNDQQFYPLSMSRIDDGCFAHAAIRNTERST